MENKILYIYIFIYIVWNEENTIILDVWGSYPVPPEAKLTPVGRSLLCREESKYAGISSLIPNSAAENRKWSQISQLRNAM